MNALKPWKPILIAAALGVALAAVAAWWISEHLTLAMHVGGVG